jgi:hypothetical protein
VFDRLAQMESEIGDNIKQKRTYFKDPYLSKNYYYYSYFTTTYCFLWHSVQNICSLAS